jgi:HD-GYP domain-containing protein (c-di-GMP phosphodiesterase class II)
MEKKLPGEGGHSIRVAVMSVAVGESLGMGPEELLFLRFAAELHDIGKLQLDRELLHKEGDLTNAEREELRMHAVAAMRVIDQIPWLAPSIEMIVRHHESWDGMGYPDGLMGQEIPLGARIIAVAEAFDMLVSDTPWHQAISEDKALNEIARCAGSQFDPDVVTSFQLIQPLIQPLLPTKLK